MTDRSVFISYRRDPDVWSAQMIYRHLVTHGWDAFLDTDSIDAGRFDTVILNEIGRRVHFIVLTSEAWIVAVSERSNWSRRELERALEFKKNVIPVLLNGFAFRSGPYGDAVLDQLGQLNALRLHADFFDAGMQVLCNRFLVQPSIREVEHCTAEEHFQRGQAFLESEAFESAVRAFDSASELNGTMPELFNNRGVARYGMHDLYGALADFDRAIALEPNDQEAQRNRGDVLQALGRLEEALDAYTRSRGRIPRKELDW